MTLAHGEPDDSGPYREFFRAPVRFDYDHSAVRYAAQWHDASLPESDAERCRALIAAFEMQDRGKLIPRLHRALRLLLLNGKSSGDELAQTISLHRRTLNRRLEAHGTTFQKVLDEVRFEVARQLLGNTNKPISDISAALCYAEVSAFTHAFRRWAGTTPAAWRKSAQAA